MFTAEQIKTLSRYEDNFNRVILASWWRAMTSRELREVYDTLVAATGSKLQFNPNCSACVGELLRVTGVLYFESKKAAEMPQISTRSDETINYTSKAGKPVKTRKSKK